MKRGTSLIFISSFLLFSEAIELHNTTSLLVNAFRGAFTAMVRTEVVLKNLVLLAFENRKLFIFDT